MENPDTGVEVATLAGGCFWCLEAVYNDLNGVLAAESGYMGGHTPNPTYKDVCSGRTGHAEVVRVTFDPQALSFRELLEVFFAIHDPTTLNRQGNDVGAEYRSAIFFHSPEQQAEAEATISALASEQTFSAPIVTEVTAAEAFHKAEWYHDDYFLLNSNQPYCRLVVAPKLEKFRRYFGAKSKAAALPG